mgnify:CR=1 FL=1
MPDILPAPADVLDLRAVFRWWVSWRLAILIGASAGAWWIGSWYGQATEHAREPVFSVFVIIHPSEPPDAALRRAGGAPAYAHLLGVPELPPAADFFRIQGGIEVTREGAFLRLRAPTLAPIEAALARYEESRMRDREKVADWLEMAQVAGLLLADEPAILSMGLPQVEEVAVPSGREPWAQLGLWLTPILMILGSFAWLGRDQHA